MPPFQKIIFKAFFVLAAIFSYAPNLFAETIQLQFEDIPGLIRTKNGVAKSADLNVQAAEKRKGYLGRSFLPTLSADIGAERFQTGNYDDRTEPYGAAEARINLFKGGKDRLQSEVYKFQTQLASATGKMSVQKEISSARKLFWELVFTRELIFILNEALQRNEKSLGAAKRRIDRGLSTDTDRLEFEIHRSQLKEEVESLEHATLLIKIELLAILGLSKDAEIATLDRVPHDHNDDLLNATFSKENYSDFQAVQAQTSLATAQKKVSSRWWSPSLDVYGGYYLYTLRDRDYLNRASRDDRALGVRLSVDINPFDSINKSSANTLLAQASAFEAEQRGRIAEAAVEVAKEDMKHEHELIHNSEERIDQGKKYLARTMDEYGRGVKNSLEVLSAAQKYLSFERQYAERRKEYQMAKIPLMSLLEK